MLTDSKTTPHPRRIITLNVRQAESVMMRRQPLSQRARGDFYWRLEPARNPFRDDERGNIGIGARNAGHDGCVGDK